MGIWAGYQKINEEVSTPEYLQRIKEEMMHDIIGNKNIEQEKDNAKLLENFFNTVGGIKVNPENLVQGVSLKLLKDIVDKKLGLLKDKKFNFENIINNFRPEGMGDIKNILGHSYEYYMEELMNNIIQTAQSKRYIKKGSEVVINERLGSATTNFTKNITDAIEKEVNEKILEAYKEEQKRWKENKNEENIDVKKANVAVSAKIDQATKIINFETRANLNPIFAKILNLLSEATFSEKAYKTSGDIRIGSTNSFRVFMAVNHGTGRDAIYRWERMLNCMEADHTRERNHDPSSALLFYQIRWIYELTGYGLSYSKEKINQSLGAENWVKYLIYYHPGSGVQVLSTAALIDDWLKELESNDSLKYNKEYFQGPEGKKYALYAQLKVRMSQGKLVSKPS